MLIRQQFYIHERAVQTNVSLLQVGYIPSYVKEY